MSTRSIRIEVPLLARVEGEGALDLTIVGGRIEDLRLRIFEPPRFFEKLLEGRSYAEVPDIVARICGICPVAYQMSAVHALEAAFGVEVTPWVRAMRRLIYCGEWIESHALHIHLLAAIGGRGLLEFMPGERVMNFGRLITEDLRFKDGRVFLPQGAGLGFEFAEAEVEKYAVRN
jgi:Ni,Fe-hydrogenase III large subunit